MYLSNLGAALQTRFERVGEMTDLDDAITTSQEAVAVAVAPPRIRAGAARGWGRSAAAGGRWEQATAGFTAAIDLLSPLIPRSLARTDQEGLLAELGSLGADAAACALRAGQPARAVELFEQGRGVLLGQALDTRTDLTALAARHPELAGRFTDLCAQLDQPTPAAGPVAVDTAGAIGHPGCQSHRR
ncbi:hypothetical protein [Protofrankia coriariae]|uniref:hypothetical protein n=1 Tax=Protofrankia coriariae TaxID=1562887 RepID=UPI00069A54C5|nr:hypothetical protein [Protofrankia coriariae]